jgi:hypothetical protein
LSMAPNICNLQAQHCSRHHQSHQSHLYATTRATSTIPPVPPLPEPPVWYWSFQDHRGSCYNEQDQECASVIQRIVWNRVIARLLSFSS